MHNKIYNMIILTFKGEDYIMDEMEAQCGKLGPAWLHVLPRGPVQLYEPRRGRSTTSAPSSARPSSGRT
eukprot:1371419-Prymnesium_polylepis.1